MWWDKKKHDSIASNPKLEAVYVYYNFYLYFVWSEDFWSWDDDVTCSTQFGY